jgi:hypothetical protein
MRPTHLPMRLLRTALILVGAYLCLAAAKPVAAQQTSDSVRVSQAHPAPASVASAPLPGPRVAPSEFQAYRPAVAQSDAALGSSAAAGSGGGRPIVISTLALVLIIIIIVLLVR